MKDLGIELSTSACQVELPSSAFCQLRYQTQFLDGENIMFLENLIFDIFHAGLHVYNIENSIRTK